MRALRRTRPKPCWCEVLVGGPGGYGSRTPRTYSATGAASTSSRAATGRKTSKWPGAGEREDPEAAPGTAGRRNPQSKAERVARTSNSGAYAYPALGRKRLPAQRPGETPRQAAPSGRGLAW
ncbi:hypothetical protein GCM10010377_52200 [Streptomyces viridiviolaceus]|nr:hypothetical protein GCM10010377_52200 [Streptomyces viridiviolaceus]